MNLALLALLTLFGLGSFAYVGVCLFLYLGQRRLMFYPCRTPSGTPARLGLDYEDLWIPIASTGEQLHGWWVPHPDPTAPVLLYLHGNTGNVGCFLKRIQGFRQLGCTVVLVDYRGYGRSEGAFPTEARFYEDARSVLQYLQQVRQVPATQLLIYGHSLGGAIAIDLMQNRIDAAGLIIEGSFTSMKAVARGIRRFRGFPVQWLVQQEFNSIQKVKHLKVPVLYVHGALDRTVPAYMSQQLFAASPEPKDLAYLAQAGHLNVYEVGGEPYWQRLQQFIQQTSGRHLLLEHLV